MEYIKHGYEQSKAFSASIIEWRSTFTAPYLMLINGAFWWSVFYTTRENQFKLLVSLAGVIFGWDVLLSASHEHSILVHFLLWPLNNTFRALSVALSLSSAYLLQNLQLEKSCWIAYATVGLLMVNPVWQYHKVSESIFDASYTCAIVTKDYSVHYVIRPCVITLGYLKYIVLLEWFPILCAFVKAYVLHVKRRTTDSCIRLRTSVYSAIVYLEQRICQILSAVSFKIRHFCASIKQAILDSLILAYCWVTSRLLALKNAIIVSIAYGLDRIFSAVNAVKNFIHSFSLAISSAIISSYRNFKLGVFSIVETIRCAIITAFLSTKSAIYRVLLAIRNTIIDSICTIKSGILLCSMKLKYASLKVYSASRNGFLSVLHLLWLWLCHAVNSIRSCFIQLLLAIKNSAVSIFKTTKWHILRTVRQIKLWVNLKIIEPTKRAYLATKEFLRYWCCAYWWPNLKQWLKIKIGDPIQRGFNYFCYGLVYVFLGYWIEPLGCWIRKAIKHLIAYFNEKAVIPFKKWLRAKFSELLILLKRLAHSSALLIRDSVLWPLLLLLADWMKTLYGYIHARAIQPLMSYAYDKYKIAEDYTLIHIIAPTLKVIVDHIPEKSPFCDDTDTELEGFLPEGVLEDEETADSDTDSTAETANVSIRPPTPLTDDEVNFIGRARLPSINDSESSDEEFDLRPIYQNLHRKTHRSIPKDPSHEASRIVKSAEMPSNNRRSKNRSREQTPFKEEPKHTENFVQQITEDQSKLPNPVNDVLPRHHSRPHLSEEDEFVDSILGSVDPEQLKLLDIDEQFEFLDAA